MLSVAAAVFFVLPPHFSLYVQDPSKLLLLLLFILVTLSNVILITGMRFAIERKRDEQALQASKDHLQFALDAALLGWWQYDPRRRAISVDTRFKEIFDVTADEIPVEKQKAGASGRRGKVWGGPPGIPRSRQSEALAASVPGSAARRRGPMGRGALACSFRRRPA